MIAYLIKSSLCLVLLWGFYILFLEQEKMHHLKRFYLLFSLIFAYTIPLITITYTTDVVVNPDELQQPITYVTQVHNIEPEEVSINYLFIALWSIYGIGVFAFAIRFIRNIYNLIKKVRRNENLKEPSHVNVLLSNSIVPYTFLKYIFVSKKEFQKKTIPQEVLLHEKTHVQQRHTLDILFVEILQVIFWFNPMWFWIKKSIRLNHEFLADQKVLKQQFSIHNYMNLLVNYPNSTHHTVLTSPINYSLTKKRIVMMSQQFSKTRAAARLLLLLPILLGCMLLFTNKIIAQQKNIKYTKTVSQTHPDKKIKIRVKNDQITVNGTATKLSDFASTIDEMTKQWRDDELTEFQFDVQIMNSEDGFVEDLNEAYRDTRLYNANSDGHDLIPSPPPLPETPKISKGKTNSVPISPVPRIKKVKSANVPTVPTPPKAPLAPSYSQTELDQIEDDVEQEMLEAEEVMHEAEQVRLQAEIERTMALEQAETEREIAMTIAEEARVEAEEIRAIAMVEAQEAREIAMEAVQEAREIAMEKMHLAREKSHRTREEGVRRAERLRLEAEEQAMVHSRMAQEEARTVMRQAERAREKARSGAEEAIRQAEKAKARARSNAEEARKQIEKARKKARKAHDEVRKQAEKARKEARKAMAEARKEQRKAIEELKKEKN